MSLTNLKVWAERGQGRVGGGTKSFLELSGYPREIGTRFQEWRAGGLEEKAQGRGW